MRIRFVLLCLLAATAARADFREFKDVAKDPRIETALRHAAEASLKEFPKLTADNLAISVIDVTKAETVARADYHGDAPFYPASVVKVFYMADTFHQKQETEKDVDRALHEMIRVSDNDATAFIIDTITDTCSGPSLEGRALNKFIDKRRAVNRWLQPMGYDVSAMMKPWSFGPFGRDMQALGEKKENRNRATANSVASLLLWIVRGHAVSKDASKAMMALMERPLNPPRTDENQVKEFIGAALPATAHLWSKAGWTSEVRHDAAYVEMPGGSKFILVIFTRGAADDVTLLPGIAKHVLQELGGS
ncbi:MAG TPA: serine hydrolase [Thermoanaerobaculia bacterium]|nr:serine hydrolase [Thermoanaerobaculia bacterium]